MSTASHNISEPSVHHTRTYGQINYSLLFTVINTCKLCLVRFLLHDLHLLHYLGRNVFRSELRIVKKESLSVNGYLLDSLTIGRDGAVCGHFHSRKFLQQLNQHIIVRCLERRGIIFYSILLDYDRISYGRNTCRIKSLDILLHLHRTQINWFAV